MLPPILKRVENEGYKVFKEGLHNANIIGVRSSSRVPGAFDDSLYYCAKSLDGWFCIKFLITTDAGLHYFEHPFNPTKGTAILAAGQYRGAYKLGLHRGYPALVQHGAAVKIWRDRNRDNIIDIHPDQSSSTGYFGINIHKAGDHSTNVHKWSAGCQVFAREADYQLFLQLCRLSADYWSNSFTYTLLED